MVRRVVNNFTFSAAAGAANVTEVTITAGDDVGTVPTPTTFLCWLSDAATGAGLTATSASGTVTAKSASGQDMGAITAKKALFAQTLASGVFTLQITDTAKTAFFVCCQTPTGAVYVSDALETADYGS